MGVRPRDFRLAAYRIAAAAASYAAMPLQPPAAPPPALERWWEELDPALVEKLALSAAVVAAFLALRFVGRRILMMAAPERPDARLRWHLRVGQLAFLVLAGGLLTVWAPELHSIALSALAIAAALVLAGKELIMCFSGSLVRTVSESYSVGDRIELDGMRGDVVRYGLLTTTLLEIGPAHQKTGRTVVFPNSLLLTGKLINETSTNAFVLHTFVVPVDFDDDWQGACALITEIAERVAGPHAAATSKHMAESARRHGLEAPNTEVVVSLQVPDPGRVNLLVRIPAPAREKGRLERVILREFLERRSAARGA